MLLLQYKKKGYEKDIRGSGINYKDEIVIK